MIILATDTYIQFRQHAQLAIETEEERHAEEEKAEVFRSESGQVIYGIIDPYSKTLMLSGLPYSFNYHNI
jgi:hypothetical protein